MKANSSRWLGDRGVIFQWQEGYGAFSVSPSVLETVKAYIRNQPKHHEKREFEAELVAFLQKSGLREEPECRP